MGPWHHAAVATEMTVCICGLGAGGLVWGRRVVPGPARAAGVIRGVHKGYKEGGGRQEEASRDRLENELDLLFYMLFTLHDQVFVFFANAMKIFISTSLSLCYCE
jgi:hypothetical protein